jgi:hypothetical protein
MSVDKGKHDIDDEADRLKALALVASLASDNADEVKGHFSEQAVIMGATLQAVINGKRELWMWRGLAIVLFLMMISTSIITAMQDIQRHASDNIERATNWTLIKQGLERNRAMLDHNYQAIQVVDEHLRQCSGCHSHPTTGSTK